jgi:hypothetical protein
MKELPFLNELAAHGCIALCWLLEKKVISIVLIETQDIYDRIRRLNKKPTPTLAVDETCML